jgi:hypothetical protein
MSVVQVIGAALVVVGAVEFVMFRRLATRNAGIARRIVLLNTNAAFNIALGVILLVVGR